MVPMIDTHAHLHDPQFDPDREQVLDRARQAGVERLVTIGTDLETSRQAVATASRHPAVYATVGIHPHDVKTIQADTLAKLQELAGNPRVVAYGEIGLDFYYMHSPKALQIQYFRGQIRLAKSIGLPMVIHSREAPDETLAILREEGAEEVGGILHCFAGDLKMARQAIDLNFFISFSGILTFNNATGLHAVAREIPMERLLIETDCPYLAPVPHRGKRNEPAFVRLTAEKVAQLRGLPLNDVARQTVENSRKIFRAMV